MTTTKKESVMGKLPMVRNRIPALPQGVTIGDQPSDIDLMTRRRGKYDWVMETLKVIDSTKTIQFDLKTIPFEKKKMYMSAIKNGIISSARRLKFSHRIKWGELDGVFHVWCNR